MFITDRFVLLNFPKTGSTFARNVLAELHRPTALRALFVKLGLAKPVYQDLILPRYVVDPSVPVRTTQHLVYAQVPEVDRHKLLLSVVRDPFSRLISAFEYRDWARFPMAPIEELHHSWPTFPELTFQEFLEMNYLLGPKQLIGDLPLPVDVGPLTLQFIRFYARDPRRYILDLRPGSDLLTDQDRHFPSIRFLHTEHLNKELHDLLLELGYARERIDFILERGKVNSTERSRTEYFTPTLRALVLRKERLFFQRFPEYLPSPSVS